MVLICLYIMTDVFDIFDSLDDIGDAEMSHL